MNGKVYIITHAENEGPGLMGGFFERLGWEEVGLSLWRGDELPETSDSAAGVVMLGGPMNVYQEKEYPFLKKEDLFIRRVLREGVPFLGICLGSQLLAKACGGVVTQSPEKERGWYDVQLTREGQQDDLFRGLGQTLSVFQWHDDTFAVPDGGISLPREGRAATGLQDGQLCLRSPVPYGSNGRYGKGVVGGGKGDLRRRPNGGGRGGATRAV